MVFAMLQLCYFSQLADLKSLNKKIIQFSGSFHYNIIIRTSQTCRLRINVVVCGRTLEPKKT